MGSKHKIGQAARRKAREEAGKYRDKLLERLKVFNECLRPRPRFVPRTIWRFLANLIVDTERLENFLNGKEVDKKAE